MQSGASVSSSGGSLVLQGTAAGNSSSREGVHFAGSNSLTATAGNLSVTGTGTTNGRGINLSSSSLTLNNPGAGSFGLAGYSVSSDGFRVSPNATVSTAGNLALAGTSTAYVGILFNGGTALTVNSGNLVLSGFSTIGSGLQLRGAGTISNNGSGLLTLAGSTASYRGVDIFNGMTRTVSGNVSFSGTAASGIGMNVDGGNGITLSSGNLALGGASTSGIGVLFKGVAAFSNAGVGSFSVAGSSGSVGLGLNPAATLTTSGELSLSGSSTASIGTVLAATSTLVNSGTGRLMLSGHGGMDLGATLTSSTGTLVLAGSGAITQSAGAIGGAMLALQGANAQFSLNAAGNTLATVAGYTGSVSLNSSTSMTVGTVDGSSGLTTSGAVLLRTSAGADIRLAQPVVSSATGDAVVVASGRNFINDAGAGAIGTGAGGRFIVYSTDWAADSPAGLNAARLYNRSFAADPPASIAQAGSWFVYSRQPLLTVTAHDATRVYGDANPAFAATVAGFVNGDSASAAYGGSAALSSTATLASGVGSYGLTPGPGTLASSLGYGFVFVPATLGITPRPITVTADAQSRAYGQANPSLGYSVGGAGLVNGDALSGALATAAAPASDVGSYAITQGTLAASANYALNYVGANLLVGQGTFIVTAHAQSRFYGDANPVLSYSIGGNVAGTGHVLSGALATAAEAGSKVGGYSITQGTLAAPANYALSYVGATLTVMPRAITVVADAQSRVYGEANPSFSYTVHGAGLVNGDALSGVLVSAATAASNVGNYPILAGSLAATPNYTLAYVGNDLTVVARPAAAPVPALPSSPGQGDSKPVAPPTAPTAPTAAPPSALQPALPRLPTLLPNLLADDDAEMPALCMAIKPGSAAAAACRQSQHQRATELLLVR